MSYPTFNLPAVSTCPGSTPECRRTCYALKAERQYREVLPCRTSNFEATKQAAFVANMVADIRRKAPTIFRIHESGDFYSRAYFRKWVAIAQQCPETRFFAFTKVFALFKEDRTANLVLIASIFPDTNRDKVPAGAATFEAVPKGAEADGTRCAGSCDNCGICPFAKPGLQVWTELH